MYSNGGSFGTSAAAIYTPGTISLTPPAPPWKFGASPESMFTGLNRA
jgi:hypothetical protein